MAPPPLPAPRRRCYDLPRPPPRHLPRTAHHRNSAIKKSGAATRFSYRCSPSSTMSLSSLPHAGPAVHPMTLQQPWMREERSPDPSALPPTQAPPLGTATSRPSAATNRRSTHHPTPSRQRTTPASSVAMHHALSTTSRFRPPPPRCEGETTPNSGEPRK